MRLSSALQVLILVAAFFRRSSSSENSSEERTDYGRESVKLLYGEDHGISWTDLAAEHTSTPILRKDYTSVHSLDYHYKRNLIFFTRKNAIWRKVWADGELEYKIVDNDVEPVATLAVDWVHDRIYWNTWQRTVWRSDLEGDRRELLLTDMHNLTLVDTLAVDPYMMYLFLATHSGYVLRTDLKGKCPVKLNARLEQPSIALDTHNRRLYIAGLSSGPALQSFDYDGSNVINYNIPNNFFPSKWNRWNWSDFLLRNIGVFSGLEGESTQLFWVHEERRSGISTVWKANLTEDRLYRKKQYEVKNNPHTVVHCMKVYHSEVQARPRYWDTEHREWPEETDLGSHGSTTTNNVTVSNNNNNNNVTASNNNNITACNNFNVTASNTNNVTACNNFNVPASKNNNITACNNFNVTASNTNNVTASNNSNNNGTASNNNNNNVTASNNNNYNVTASSVS